MAEPPPPHIRLSFGNHTGLFCPCCSSPFPDAEHVILHLSSDPQCGRWAAETLPSVDGMDTRPGHDYFEDMDAAQDGMVLLFSRTKLSNHV
jgi:hypothetical protein